MKYRVEHRTHYQYKERVSHCYNLAYMTPLSSSRQRCVSSKITITPTATHTTTDTDYFGNESFHFEILQPHSTLTIEAESIVETSYPGCLARLNDGLTYDQTLTALKEAKQQSTLLAREFTLNSPFVKTDAKFKDFALPSFAGDRPLLACVEDLTRRIFEDFQFSPQATTIATPLDDVLHNKAGVCQDFAHLQIACLRSVGIPARYVSGYLETLPPPGQEKLIGADATHAWISVYSIDEGWVEFDPTNNCVAGEQHIVTAIGRDYNDVTPLRGVIYGGGEAPELSVAVDVSRLD